MLLAFSDLSHALYGARPIPAGSSAFSAVVSLHLSDPQNPEFDYFCSGVLIAPDKVLTTGHCIEGMGSEVYEQGAIFSYEPHLLKVKISGVKHSVANVTLAPSYFESAGFADEDLAIIKLKKAVSTKPIKLALLSSTKVLQAVTLVSQGAMANSTITQIKTYSGRSVIYTDGLKAGVCGGDSGGALLITVGSEYQLAGLLSAQKAGCEKTSGVSIFPRTF